MPILESNVRSLANELGQKQLSSQTQATQNLAQALRGQTRNQDSVEGLQSRLAIAWQDMATNLQNDLQRLREDQVRIRDDHATDLRPEEAQASNSSKTTRDDIAQALEGAQQLQREPLKALQQLTDTVFSQLNQLVASLQSEEKQFPTASTEQESVRPNLGQQDAKDKGPQVAPLAHDVRGLINDLQNQRDAVRDKMAAPEAKLSTALDQNDQSKKSEMLKAATSELEKINSGVRQFSQEITARLDQLQQTCGVKVPEQSAERSKTVSRGDEAEREAKAAMEAEKGKLKTGDQTERLKPEAAATRKAGEDKGLDEVTAGRSMQAVTEEAREKVQQQGQEQQKARQEQSPAKSETVQNSETERQETTKSRDLGEVAQETRSIAKDLEERRSVLAKDTEKIQQDFVSAAYQEDQSKQTELMNAVLSQQENLRKETAQFSQTINDRMAHLAETAGIQLQQQWSSRAEATTTRDNQARSAELAESREGAERATERDQRTTRQGSSTVDAGRFRAAAQEQVTQETRGAGNSAGALRTALQQSRADANEKLQDISQRLDEEQNAIRSELTNRSAGQQSTASRDSAEDRRLDPNVVERFQRLQSDSWTELRDTTNKTFEAVQRILDDQARQERSPAKSQTLQNSETERQEVTKSRDLGELAQQARDIGKDLEERRSVLAKDTEKIQQDFVSAAYQEDQSKQTELMNAVLSQQENLRKETAQFSQTINDRMAHLAETAGIQLQQQWSSRAEATTTRDNQARSAELAESREGAERATERDQRTTRQESSTVDAGIFREAAQDHLAQETAKKQAEKAAKKQTEVRFADHVDLAFAENASYQVGNLTTINRVRTTKKGRRLLSLDTVQLTRAQREAATRIHGKFMDQSFQTGWQASANAREVADMVRVSQLWNQGTPQAQQQARDLAREVFDLHRERFWARVQKTPALRDQFTDAGMKFTGKLGSAPTYTLADGTRAIMTLEHNFRLADDPMRALNSGNLQFVLDDENSYNLERIRDYDPFQH